MSMMLRRKLLEAGSGEEPPVDPGWEDGVPYEYELSSDGSGKQKTNDLPCEGTSKVTMTVSNTVSTLKVYWLDDSHETIETVSKSTYSKTNCANGFATAEGAKYVRISMTTSSWSLCSAITPIA